MRRTIARLAGLALVAGGLTFGSAVPAFACSCATQPLADQLDTADVVFVGTVGELVDGTDYTNLVEVSEVYRGAVPAVVTVNTGQEGLFVENSCDFSLRPGDVRLFLAAGSGHEYELGACSETGPLNERVRDRLATLVGPAAAPEESLPAATQSASGFTVLGWRVGAGWGLGAAGLLALVGGAVVVARRSRRQDLAEPHSRGRTAL